MIPRQVDNRQLVHQKFLPNTLYSLYIYFSCYSQPVFCVGCSKTAEKLQKLGSDAHKKLIISVASIARVINLVSFLSYWKGLLYDLSHSKPEVLTIKGRVHFNSVNILQNAG